MLFLTNNKTFFQLNIENYSKSILDICFLDLAVIQKKKKNPFQIIEKKQCQNCKYYSKNISIFSSKFFLCIIFWKLQSIIPLIKKSCL